MRYIRYLSFSLFTTYLALYLDSLADNVPDVTVTNEPFSLAQTLTLSTETITQQQIRYRGVRTVSEVLNGQSNVQLQQFYESMAVPSIRGFGDNAADNVLILINGLPITNPDISPILMNAIPLHEIDHITILSGSAGVLYGDQAVGGVIDIVTQTPKKNNVQIDVTGGSYGLQQYDADVTRRWNNGLALRAGATHLQTHNYREHNNEEKNNAQISLQDQYNSGSFSLRYHYLQNNLQYPGALSAEQLAQNRRQAQNNTDFDDQQHNDAILQWNQILNEHSVLQQGAIVQTMQGAGVLTSPFSENRYLLEWSPQLSSTGNIRHTTVQNQTGMLLQGSQYQLHGAGFDNQSQQNKWALFTQFTMPLLSHTRWSVGGRTAQSRVSLDTLNSQNNKTNTAAITDVGVEWNPTSQWMIYARRAGNYRFPKAEENAFSLNNTPLNTQTGVSYETGFRWQQRGKKVGIDFFDLLLNNEIMFVPSRSGLFGTNQNLPPTERLGTTAYVSYPITSRWRMGMDYTFINARFSSGFNQGKRIPFVALNKGRWQTDYRTTQHSNLHTEVIIVGNRFPGGDITNQGTLVPGYAVLNMSFNYRWKHLLATLTVNNITNTKYINYAEVLQTPTLQTFYYPAAGRNFWIRLSFDI